MTVALPTDRLRSRVCISQTRRTGIGERIRLGEITERMGLGQAIHRVALLQIHVLAGPRRNPGQQGAAAVNLDQYAFPHGNQGTDSSLNLILDGYPGQIMP